MTREKFANPVTRNNLINSIKKEAPAFKGKEVQLCFVTDPYQVFDQEVRLTREVIEVLHESGVKVSILTKGGNRSLVDFDLFEKNPSLSKYGTTLTFLDEAKSLEWEPGAAPPEERINALQKAKEIGVETWVSLEPVLDPQAVYSIIERTHTFVDMFKVGTWNYHEDAKKIDWKLFGTTAKELMDHLGCNYYLKNDLVEKMNG